MQSLLVIFALVVLNSINVTNGDCVAATGTACKTTYDAANTTTDAQKCPALYTYGSCLANAECYGTTYKTAFDADAGATVCGQCTITTGVACFSYNCSLIATVKTCLEGSNCYTDAFNTAYSAFEAGCNGCGTVTVSVLMMFLSTLLVFVKNY